MNTIAAMDETRNNEFTNPGYELAALRQQKGIQSSMLRANFIYELVL